MNNLNQLYLGALNVCQQHLLSFFDRIVNCKPPHIAVIGDVMLDRYLYGAVGRISPEAPIPILNYERERDVLGGAGNVVANLCGLGACVFFISRIGSDEAGGAIQKLIAEKNDQTSGSVVFSPVRAGITTLKTRLVGNGRQQMLRLDREEKVPLTPEQEELVISKLEAQLSHGLDAVILSDYAKGVCTAEVCRRAIDVCMRAGVPVFIDPKGKDWQRYAGAELVTPNMKELIQAAGKPVPNTDDQVTKVADELRERFGIKNILVTRSEKGSSFIGHAAVFHSPSRAVEVYDVSGAGDTVIASVVFFSSLGCGWEDCCELANIAAQVVIAKAGTYAVSLAEIKKLVLPDEDEKKGYEPKKKLCSITELEQMRREWRKKGQTVVFTNGCFDVFHAGHVDSLQRARCLGDRLIVGLNSDRSVKILKGENRPINTEKNRACVLAALECVDAVTIFDEETPENLLSVICPDILVKGGDYKEDQIAGRQYAGRVVILPLVEGLSSTSIIDRMYKNND